MRRLWEAGAAALAGRCAPRDVEAVATGTFTKAAETKLDGESAGLGPLPSAQPDLAVMECPQARWAIPAALAASGWWYILYVHSFAPRCS
jgi:hypothetical protein